MAFIHVMILSDGTGETANQMLKAALLQFGEGTFITRHAHIRTAQRIDELLTRHQGEHVLVLFTFVEKALREHARRRAEECGAESLDLLGPLME
jgi:regulator of PEP synthase PpsR (kinase-PPPase family)